MIAYDGTDLHALAVATANSVQHLHRLQREAELMLFTTIELKIEDLAVTETAEMNQRRENKLFETTVSNSLGLVMF